MKDKNEDDIIIVNESEKVLQAEVVSPVVFQSWQLTKVKYNFNKTEKNIFLKIVEIAQKYLNKDTLGKRCEFEMKEFAGKEYPMITFPIKDLLKNSNNYTYICDSLTSLGEKSFGLPATDSWDFNQIFLFGRISANKVKGLAQVELTHSFWEAFLNMQVYKMIDPTLAYNFESVFTMRMYELLVGNKREVTYKLVHLMEMFCLEKTYTSSHFVQRVINVAQKEMKEMEQCPFYFEYKVLKAGKKLDALVFSVVDKSNPMLPIAPKEKELSDAIEASVKNLFTKSIRKDLEYKLIKCQKLVGEEKLASLLLDIYNKASELKANGALKGTFVAYLSGSLDNIYTQSEQKAAEQKISEEKKKSTQRPVDEKREDPSLVDASFIKNRAQLAGISFEECIKALGAVLEEDGKYRIVK